MARRKTDTTFSGSRGGGYKKGFNSGRADHCEVNKPTTNPKKIKKDDKK